MKLTIVVDVPNVTWPDDPNEAAVAARGIARGLLAPTAISAVDDSFVAVPGNAFLALQKVVANAGTIDRAWSAVEHVHGEWAPRIWAEEDRSFAERGGEDR